MNVTIIAPALFAICVLGVAFDIFRQKAKREKAAREFLAEHPGAVKLYLHVQNKFQDLTIPKVNGAPPVYFKDNIGRGIYLVPGTVYELNLLCEISMPGSGGTKKQIYTDVLTITPRQSYRLEFDEAAKRFILVDM
jgi:thioredoxin-related protein